ncbi:helix-turn-helix domain-containing protein [Endozoicomonas sp. G2_1]|uniref:GlxA family transcriptional regulator n=1 Tax=Endozoicomonas sp. G2_1 TaxID=2821091 RepID=UPI001ADCBFEC|nr:helix-turn-helix domain-containing protein [Endozoicomonas sp. G2_1]MBO9488772.1 helix-turn-helix domain-containing protein [Endozoicomonas sp. G2_1]
MKIQVLATNNCMVSAVYGLLDVFYAANFCLNNRYQGKQTSHIDCQIVTINNQPVVGYNGISVAPTAQISSSDYPDIVIVSSTVGVAVSGCGGDIDVPDQAKINHWLNQCHQRQTLVASYCTGSFVLASAGLLKNKVATTHWRSAGLFSQLFPYVKLSSDKMIVDNGDIVCSAGSMSYIDLALHLTERFYTRELASDCAKLMVFDPVREKQSPYVSFRGQKNHDDQAILSAQEWLESHYTENIVIEQLADLVKLTPRTFKRRFKQATGENAISYLQRIRVEHVKDKLEHTTNSINNIIWSVGYEDISSFRQLFKRFTGLTPKDYRQKFTSSVE